jgi:hypothetical protein
VLGAGGGGSQATRSDSNRNVQGNLPKMAQVSRLDVMNVHRQALAILNTDIADFIGGTSWWDLFGLVGDPGAAAPNRLPAANGPPRSQPVFKLLLGDNVLRLGSFLTLGYFHGNFLSFF